MNRGPAVRAQDHRLVAHEQVLLEQVARERHRVDGHEHPVPPRRAVVDRARDDGAPRAELAVQPDRRVALGQEAHLAEQLHDRGAIAGEQRLEVDQIARVGAAAPRFIDGAHQPRELGGVERLDQRHRTGRRPGVDAVDQQQQLGVRRPRRELGDRRLGPRGGVQDDEIARRGELTIVDELHPAHELHPADELHLVPFRGEGPLEDGRGLAVAVEDDDLHGLPSPEGKPWGLPPPGDRQVLPFVHAVTQENKRSFEWAATRE
jgi:hypothetical protein